MNDSRLRTVAIIGGGPSGLMAADVISKHGVRVEVYDSMPSVGRKFLMAGKGGMNITHIDELPLFLERYGVRREDLKPMLDFFSPDTLRAWIHGLGIETFVGSSGRVFPADMKAAPLLRALLHRLRNQGVIFHVRHRWQGWNAADELNFATPTGDINIEADAVLLALGGGSWPMLGSTGAWVPLLEQKGVSIAPLLPANCGFDINWSEYFRSRFAGQPLKGVVVSFTDAKGIRHRKQGDCVITASGIEGGVIYALSSALRDTIVAEGCVNINLDLTPGKDLDRIQSEVAHPRGSRSISSHLHSRAGLNSVQVALLRECVGAAEFTDAGRLAQAIKALPLKLGAARPLIEAISSAGGVTFEAMDHRLMLKKLPGVFCAGEMLDWEAPTGGYLLTACFASGYVAGAGILNWFNSDG